MNFKVNSLTSDKTALPLEYYKLSFCQPARIQSSAENLGEVLRGDRIFNSLYQAQTGLDEICKVVCRVQGLTKSQTFQLKRAIDDEYRVNMILDNLPAAVRSDFFDEETQTHKSFYERGFPVGFKVGETVGKQSKPSIWSQRGKFAKKNNTSKFFINNHLRFTILVHSQVDSSSHQKTSRIVGFEVKPLSVKHSYSGWNEQDPKITSCTERNHPSVTIDPESKKTTERDENTIPPQEVQEGAEIVFTYDVTFRESPIRWASRWDVYLQMKDGKGVHWFSVINSCLVVVFLSLMVGMLFLRALKRDISKYNLELDLESAENESEESGWKLVHGDVFRPPPNTQLLSVFIGAGFQLIGMTLVVMVFAVLGFLSPANRGGLMTTCLLLFTAMGFFNGYFVARTAKIFAIGDWKGITVKAAVTFPGIAFGIFFLLNLLAWEQKSAGAAPFTTLLSICGLWFLVSVPLTILGSYFGHKKPPPEQPTRTNKIPRQVPHQKWYLNPYFTTLTGGILPFAAVFIELFFILSSIWHHQVYYVFGILSIVFAIVILTCAEIAILVCYFHLCAEDYRWWWRSFFSAGGCALYVFTYSAYYFFANLEISRVIPSIMYFSYMGLLSFGFFVVCGTVGFVSCFSFVRAIYGSVKID